MLLEATTLTSAAQVIADTLQKNYAIAPGPVFSAAGLDYSRVAVAGARYPWAGMQSLWSNAVAVTGDPAFGLYAGRRIRPTTFHALGYAWLASQTLHGSLERLCRYVKVISTAPIALRLDVHDDTLVLTDTLADPTHVPSQTATDAFIAAIVQLCRIATDSHFAPRSVALERSCPDDASSYTEVLRCPVVFDAETTHIEFDLESVDRPLPGDNAELARANDHVAEQYLRSLEPHKVASEVRELLLAMLPSGKSSQTSIARRMNRSLSTLQRQLQSEGTSYQEIRDDTRSALARDYVRDRDLTLSQVAYMLGFSDQSNFSRAFKRWTGQTPREFRQQSNH